MDIPKLKSYLRLSGHLKEVSIYDIKFYPYLEPDEDPVFAAVAGRQVYVCKPGTTKNKPLDILSVLEDPEEGVAFNSVAWTQDSSSGDALVCVAGSGTRQIKILNVITGELDRVLDGHGGDINDLRISPKSPHILASCSGDYTVRIWNLEPRYQKQPCAVVLSGEGHRQTILTIAFHPEGKWLLTGGQDTKICLWALPNVPDENAGTDYPTVVHYPHFASIEIHSDYVDCVEFWGDLILSRASKGHNANEKPGNEIILWRIEGFSSSNDHVPDAPMLDLGLHTQSAFGGRFQRLLTFKMKDADPFYMRFGLLDQPGVRPMLAMGNTRACFSFWDLQNLEEGYETTEAEESVMPAATKTKKRKKGVADIVLGLSRAASVASNDSSALASHISTPVSDPKYEVCKPYEQLAPHKAKTIPCDINFAIRAVSWSNDGKWCVGVGDYGMMAIFGCDKKA